MMKKLILLIDDEATVRDVLTRVLESRDFEVATANDGNEGLKYIEKRKPDLIVLDLKMPGMSGVGFLNQISDSQGKPRYPVLIFTAHENMREFLSNTEVAGFLLKPCSTTALLSEIDRILAAGPGEPATKVKSGRKRKVLLAEDDRETCQRLQRSLEDAGCVMETVTNGSDLIGRAIVWGPDAIVMKEVLPHLNGDVVAGILNGIPKTNALPIILYDDTGYIQTHHDLLLQKKNIVTLVRSSASLEIVAAVRQLFVGFQPERI